MAKKEKNKLSGGLLVWAVITSIFIIFGLIGNFTNIYVWIIDIALAIGLVMVLKGKGTRWYIIVLGIVLGTISLYSACAVSANSICMANRQACMVMKDKTELEQMATLLRTGTIIMSAYMFGSSIYFIVSKEVKTHFKK